MASRAPAGFVVSPRTVVRRLRAVPGAGEIFVAVGDAVRAEDAVASLERPGAVHVVNVAAQLGLPRGRILETLTVGVGDRVTAGQPIAALRSLFGLWTTRVAAPIDGTVEAISAVTGQIVLRTDPAAIRLGAYVSGTVVGVRAGEGVEIEAEVALVQGALGLGGEAIGELALAGGAGTVLAGDALDGGHAGQVVVAFGRISLAAMRRARELGVAALVGGSARGDDLVALAGREVNLAATGDEEIGLAIVLTEGLGELAMANRAAEILSALAGRRVSVRGATQVRAGVIRPELVGPPLPGAPLASEDDAAEPAVGARVRVVRGRRFGAIGEIASMPAAPVRIATGAAVLVYEVRLEGGQSATVPRQNVELIS